MAKKTQAKAKETAFSFKSDGGDVALDTIIAGLNKSYGDGTITTISGPSTLKKLEYQLPSGSIGLDLGLGVMYRRADGTWVTGYGPGRIGEIFGPEGSGKTTLMLLMIANAQRMGAVCALLDTEHSLDVNYAMKLGVQMDKLLFSQPSTGEEAFNIAETLIRSGRVHLVVIDSVVGMVPKAEVEGETGDSVMGKHALMMSQGCRKLNNALGSGVHCNVLFTNQIREKVGVVFGSPETQPGGRALKFFASYRMDVRPGTAIFDRPDAEDKQRIGHVLKISVIKNKLAAPFRKCEVPLYYGVGLDNATELIDLGVAQGVIEKTGNFHKYQGEVLGNGRINAIMELRKQPLVCYKVYNQLLTNYLRSQGYTPDLQPIDGINPMPQAGGPNMNWTPLTMSKEDIEALTKELAEQESEAEPAAGNAAVAL